MKKNLTVTEAAKAYGMSEAWFNRERWKGTGPRFLKMEGRGGRVLYPVDELESYFNSRLRRSTSDPGTAQKVTQTGKEHNKVTRIGRTKETPSAGLSPVTGQGGCNHE